MKKLLCGILALVLCTFGGCAETDEIPPETEAEMIEEAEASVEETVVLVSLGDSIAHGYGLANPKTEAYAAVVADMLEADGISAVAYNFGVDGQNSTQLVSCIDGNPEIPAAIAEADYVSISIGANNFLGSAYVFLGEYNDFKTNPSTSFTGEDMTDAFRQFNENVADGVEQLQEDIPGIIGNIRKYNETCEILFLACYNPYGAVNVTLDWGGRMPVNFAALADTCVTQMNDVIREGAAEYGYTVADVHAEFDGKADRLVCAVPVESGDTVNLGAIDPHPNKTGHMRIADVLYKLIAK